VRNAQRRFVCRPQVLTVEQPRTVWTSEFAPGEQIVVPVKNGEGRYVAEPSVLDDLERAGRVVLRYASGNPSGAERGIAAVANAAGTVVGMMPHPEHAVDPLTGAGTDGLRVFRSLLVSAVAA
jgi:phosphoribosylformylglycinamidine (FGAM) synthase-like amidotransferase family enzyme